MLKPQFLLPLADELVIDRADREDYDARLAFLAERRAQIDELWGRP